MALDVRVVGGEYWKGYNTQGSWSCECARLAVLGSCCSEKESHSGPSGS